MCREEEIVNDFQPYRQYVDIINIPFSFLL